MRKSAKKLLVLAAAMVMMFAMSLSVFAASDTTVVNKITIQGSNGKSASSTTLYVNGDFVSEKEVAISGTRNAIPQTATFDLTVAGKDKNATTIIKNLSVTPKNRAVANARIESVDGKDKLVITAVGTGKTTITVSDYGTKKSAKINVTVLKLAEEITYSAPTEEDEFTGADIVRVEQNGKVNLLAATNTDASNKGLTYTVLDSQVLVDDSWIESKNSRNGKMIPVVKVDAKGNVTGVYTKQNETLAKATIRIAAKDQKVTVGKSAKTTGIYKDVTVYVAPASYAKTDIIRITNLNLKKANAKLGKSNTYADQVLYTNKTDAAHEMMVTASAYKQLGSGRNISYEKADSQKVVYTSSNPKVATVTPDGKVTAVANGKATISAVPAYGFTSPKATFAVTVKTKPEMISAPNNLTVAITKTVKAGATLDKAVTSKSLVYTSLDEKIATVNKSGVIKGIKEGYATIQVSSKDYPSVSKNIYVEVINPVDKVVLTDAEGNAFPKAGVTLYQYDENKLTTNAPQEITINATGVGKNSTKATYGNELTIASSKFAVAGVIGEQTDDTKTSATLVANGAGSATITATAVDGSKKNATVKVTVKRLVDTFTVQNAYYENEDYVLNVVKGVDTKITAATNADASNKRFTIDPKDTLPEGVTFKSGKIKFAADYAGDGITLVLSAQDAVGNSKAYSQELVIKPVADERLAKEDEVTIWGEDTFNAVMNDPSDVTNIVMNKGVTAHLEVAFSSSDITNRNATWKVTGSGISVKNGLVTAKALTTAGREPIVKISVPGQDDNGNEITIVKEVKVRVVESDADYAKRINTKINNHLKAEDRSYLGAKVTFNEKASSFAVQITNPSVVIAEQKNTGIKDLLEDIAEPGTCYVSIYDDQKKTPYEFVRTEGTNVEVKKNEVKIADVADFTEAVDVLKDELVESGYETLGDFNGFIGYIYIERRITDYEGEFGDIYTGTYYTVSCEIGKNDMDAIIDARITEEMSKLSESGVLEAAGISNVTYNAATNAATVSIKDGKKTLETVDAAARTAVAEALKTIYAEVQYADVNVAAGGIDEVRYFDRATEDLDTAINKLFDKVKEKAGADTEIGTFDGGKADAHVVFVIGAATPYEFDYTVNFTRTAEAVDAQIDERIATEISTINPGESGLSASYDADSNTLAVKVNKTDYSVISVKGTGLFTALKNVLQDVATAGTKVTANVILEGKTTPISDLANVTDKEIMDAFAPDDINLGDLLDNNAIITIKYPQISNENLELSYKVTYELNLESIDADVNEMIVDALASAKEADPVIKTADYEDHTLTITFDGTKDKNLSDADALYEIFKAAIPNGDKGLSAVNVTVIGESGQSTVEAAKIDKFTIGDAILKATGLGDDAKVSALGGKTLKLKVVYGKAGKEIEISYTIQFTVDGNTPDPMLEEETTVEETETETEEVTEEPATEEPTEETTTEEITTEEPETEA